jgi:hypothetical protein
VGGIRVHVRPNEPDKYSLPINRILGEKLAASILEFADLGWIHDAILAIGPIEPPLVGLRIVHTQGQTFDVACWAIDVDRVQFGAAIPNLEADSRPSNSTQVLEPVRGRRRRFR